MTKAIGSISKVFQSVKVIKKLQKLNLFCMDALFRIIVTLAEQYKKKRYAVAKCQIMEQFGNWAMAPFCYEY